MKANKNITQRELKHLRRLALNGQALLKAQPFGRGINGVRRAIQHIGYVQLDTISVVERAHHHVLYSRIPGFKPRMTEQLLSQGEIFEYWSHAEAYLPIEDFRYSLPYKHAIKSGQTHWFKYADTHLMEELLDRIKIDGPMCSRDVEHKRTQNTGWWDWKPAKKALEQLFMQGDLMVCDRTGFQKTYELTERVLPAGVDARMPSIEDMAEHLLAQQLRCHGLVSLKGLTYLRRNASLRQAMKNLVNERLAEHALEQVTLPNGAVCFLNAAAFDQPMPRTSNRLTILSPFDNSVIQRARIKDLFDFDYQIECYVPAEKRKYGYFCLPLLYRDRFVGRMDCKAHRKERRLEIKSLHLDLDGLDEENFITAFETAIDQFKAFQQCDTVTMTRVNPLKFSKTLLGALGDHT